MSLMVGPESATMTYHCMYAFNKQQLLAIRQGICRTAGLASGSFRYIDVETGSKTSELDRDRPLSLNRTGIAGTGDFTQFRGARCSVLRII
jgi:hypothetical protein